MWRALRVLPRVILGVPGTLRRVLHLHAFGHARPGGAGLVLGVGGVWGCEGGAAGFEESSAEREELGLALVQQRFTQLRRQPVQLTAHLQRAGEHRALTRAVEISGTQTQVRKNVISYRGCDDINNDIAIRNVVIQSSEILF